MMASTYSVALARPSDLEALPAIELAAARLLTGHAPESVLNEVTDLDTLRDAQAADRLWVALERDTPVGFAIVEMLAEDLPHLDEIDVHPRHARHGLGTALVRAVCQWGRRGGFPEITLTTFRAVAWNMPWYARLGFEEIPPEELRAELAAVMADETARGMARAARVAMRYRCASSSRRNGV